MNIITYLFSLVLNCVILSVNYKMCLVTFMCELFHDNSYFQEIGPQKYLHLLYHKADTYIFCQGTLA